MAHAAVAASNDLAARAGAEIAEEGGNAVDVAIAAALVSMITEPGICSLGGGAFITVGGGEVSPETIDGYVEMPGRGLAEEAFGGGVTELTTAYGGGVETMIGHGSIAVPGTPAGLGLAHRRHGRAPWAALFAPAVRIAEEGFPMGSASAYYLDYVHDSLFGWHPPSREAIHDDDGRLIGEGETVVIPHLAESLRELAAEGAAAMYRGDLAGRIVDDVRAHGGLLTSTDLTSYEPAVRTTLDAGLGDWTISTNPAPAVGGAVLTAMLLLMGERPHGPWQREDVRRLVEVQAEVLGHRRARLDRARDREAAVSRLLADVRSRPVDTSASTINVSAVDGDGLACVITASAGYGSGVMPPGTGIWMNNCLGERGLNHHGLHAWEPGTRLPSNMAPTVARGPHGGMLGIGSPGAERITTAILQTLLGFVNGGMPLDDAIAHPRLHLEHRDGAVVVGYERDLELPPIDLPARSYEPQAMFFGGVTAAHRDRGGALEAGADPRRTGGSVVV